MLGIILALSLAMLTSQIDSLNKRCYDAKADYWDRFPFPEHFPKFLWQHYRPLLGNKVLDVGAGTGQVALYLKNAGFDVTCIDPSSEMVRRCNEKGLKTVQSTLQEYELQGKFGIVVAILSLIHVPQAEFSAQIQKIHACLEPEGLFVLSMLKGKGEQVDEQASGYPRFFARYSAEELRRALEGSFVELAYHEQGDYMLFFFKAR